MSFKGRCRLIDGEVGEWKREGRLMNNAFTCMFTLTYVHRSVASV